nr:hypothetical protein [Tanacetum cinerariifolium]
MRTRSRSRHKIAKPLRIEFPSQEDQFQEDPPEVLMADNRTMAQLLQAPTVGYEDAIVIPEIAATNFELKHGLINLVQNKQLFGHDKEDPHAYIRYFNKITSTMRVPNVPKSTIKLMLFPFSLEGAARIWLEKEPPRSILTWEDLVSKFINQFFPPSKTTNLRNEFTIFQQRVDESFSEAWDRFNDLLRACPHHGFSELHKLDTFYNALNVNDQDSLNSAVGGIFLDKMPSDCLKIIENKSKVCQSRAKAVVAKVNSSSSTLAISFDVAKLQDMVRALLLDKKNQYSAPAPSPTPAPIKAVESNCVTCGAANYSQGNTGFRPQMVANQIRPFGFPPVQNNQNNFNRGNNFNQNRGGNFNQSNFNQGQLHRPQVNQPPAYQAPAYQAHIPQTQSVSKTDFESYVTTNDAVLRNIQSQGAGTLPGNTITNPKEDLKGITTRSGVAYQGPTIPTPSKVVKQETKVTKDQVQTPSSQSTAPVQPPVAQPKTETLVSEPVVASVCAPMRMDECLALADLGASINLMPLSVWEGLSLLKLTPTCMTLELTDCSVSKTIGIAKDVKVKTSRTLIDVHKGELTLRIRNEAITYNLDQTSRYSANYDQMMATKIDVTDKACEEYSQEVLGFSDVTASGSLIPSDVPIISPTFPTLTLFGDSDFLLFEEADAFLDLEDDPNSPKFDPSYYDLEGDILLPEAILNSEPSPPLPNHEKFVPSFKEELKACEAKTIKSSVDEPPEVELKDLPPHLEYAFLEGDNKLPVIIAKD